MRCEVMSRGRLGCLCSISMLGFLGSRGSLCGFFLCSFAASTVTCILSVANDMSPGCERMPIRNRVYVEKRITKATHQARGKKTAARDIKTQIQHRLEFNI